MRPTYNPDWSYLYCEEFLREGGSPCPTLTINREARLLL